MFRVVFVCVGNACRSQMAEGFARAYGRDILRPASAGIAPAAAVPEETRRIMLEKNIDLSAAAPKALDEIPFENPDLLINMSGQPIPAPPGAQLLEWKVQDPYLLGDDVYRRVRDEIERRVMALVLELRGKAIPKHSGRAPETAGETQRGTPGRRGWRRGLP